MLESILVVVSAFVLLGVACLFGMALFFWSSR